MMQPAGDRLARVALPLGLLVVLVLAWQWIGDDSIRLAMPTFLRTLSAFSTMATNGTLAQGLAESNTTLVVGFAIALAIALPLGILMGSYGALERLIQPYLTIMLVTPSIATLPLLQTIFGLGMGSRTAVVCIFSVVYVTVNTMVGVSTVNPNLREMARSFNATPLQTLRHITLPAALPSIMAGIRLGLSRAIVGMVIAEFFLVGSGVGSMIRFYRARLDTGYVVALALTLVLEGVILIAVARRVEQFVAARR
jgi:NitT/TauT family transport system permease protein